VNLPSSIGGVGRGDSRWLESPQRAQASDQPSHSPTRLRPRVPGLSRSLARPQTACRPDYPHFSFRHLYFAHR
jgi:hypothetical protein